MASVGRKESGIMLSSVSVSFCISLKTRSQAFGPPRERPPPEAQKSPQPGAVTWVGLNGGPSLLGIKEDLGDLLGLNLSMCGRKPGPQFLNRWSSHNSLQRGRLHHQPQTPWHHRSQREPGSVPHKVSAHHHLIPAFLWKTVDS